MTNRRTAVLGIAAAAVGAQSGWAYGQSWPSRPIRLVVGWPPGGSVDTMARLVQPMLQAKLGATVVIDNRGGASGAIGARVVSSSPPDGYTCLMVTDAHATNESFPSLSVNALTAFQSVSLVATGPMVLAAHPSAPWRNMQDLAEDAKRRPGEIDFASAGSGGLGHVGTVLLQQKGGFKLTHIPYKGGAAGLQALLGNQVPLYMANSLLLGPYIRDGRIRALGVGSEQEIPQLPGVKSFVQQGLEGAKVETFYALLAPAAVPASLVEQTNRAVNQVLADAGIRDRIKDLGMVTAGGSPDACQRFLVAEIERWNKTVRENGITLDA